MCVIDFELFILDFCAYLPIIQSDSEDDALGMYIYIVIVMIIFIVGQICGSSTESF